jgi:hypothetical protein
LGAAMLGQQSGPQGLDVFQLHAQGLFVKNNRVNGLILGGGGTTVFSQSRQKPFRFLFAW